MREELHNPTSPEYTDVITEMGICYSTSELWDIQKPYRGNSINMSRPSIPDKNLYSAVDIMRLIVTPHPLDTENITIVSIGLLQIEKEILTGHNFKYIHNKYDVISGADTMHESLIESTDIIHNVIELHEILSIDSLRGFSIKRRKCIFFDEKVLQFFPIYTINLCQISCRIRAALSSCGCIPFFYNLSKKKKHSTLVRY